MLVFDSPEDIQEILTGLLPAGKGPEKVSQMSDFDRELGRSLFGGRKVERAGTAAPADFRGDFWTSWFLTGEASGSQYDILRQVIATSGAPSGHVACLAVRGSGFHGQENRGWAAVSGNLHLSLGLKCDLPAAATGLALTALPAVAVMDALDEMGLPASGPAGPGIKWVNDILVSGRKLGGVLTAANSLGGRIVSAVLGIGLNVGVAPPVETTPFTPGTTCLGENISLGDKGLVNVLGSVSRALAARFEQLTLEGPAPLMASYKRASLILGREVEIHEGKGPDGPVRRGRVLDIGPDLSLKLSGHVTPVTSGRLVLCPEQD